MIRFAALTFVALIWSSACQRMEAEGSDIKTLSREKAKQMHPEVTIRLGESGAAFLKRTASGVKVNSQPAGLDFYRMDWDKPPVAVVHFDHAAHSLTIPYVTGIQTSEDQEELKMEGFADWKIYALPSSAKTIDHSEAQAKIQSLLNDIQKAGWSQYVELSDPRLKGHDRLQFALNHSNLIGLDARYMPSAHEWMSIPDRTPWRFYANGVFMELSFSREISMMDEDKPGIYLLTIELITEREYFRRSVAPADRLRWREVLAASLKSAMLQRNQQEKSLREQGFSIDESYVDPQPFTK